MKIQILVDNPKSWIVPYAKDLVNQIMSQWNCEVLLLHSAKNVVEGDVLFLLGCEKIFEDLHLNANNIVVHESDLPKGKGWSPITWQVLEGKNLIPIALFEATEGVDAGDIYIRDYIDLEGHELHSEIKHKQGIKTKELVLNFLENRSVLRGQRQQGNETFYKKRTPIDSKLNISESIEKQFNLLRVVDNENYPAFFEKDGHKYIIKIYKENG